MTQIDKSFLPDTSLDHAVNLLREVPMAQENLPHSFPERGIGEIQTLDLLAPHVLGRAARLDNSNALTHMDPPTPWITWAMALWNARLNQNLLHPATAPFAIEAEKKVMDWLAPVFGMNGGHMCSGSTIANLTALWAARDVKGIEKIVASKAAHISIEKAAKILGLPYEQISTNSHGQIDSDKINDISNACLVLTAGTTATGVIDSLALTGKAKWTHVDAAWAGPLRLSPNHAHLLDGIDAADSVAISAHKWFFQPKDSALIMFRDTDLANSAISLGGGYLATPNIGVQGSRGASAIPLLATMIAWGKEGIADRIDHAMSMANMLATELIKEDNISLWAMPTTGITVFRPLTMNTEEFYQRLPEGMFSTCMLDNVKWLRSVAANPLADIEEITSKISEVIHGTIA
ncbi:aspartate aminotransferase family protein [Acidithiobacillus thiooxidans]|uniref:pyridoxal phosphate-dependent decarboxylase family protein n=1 Tax=Acidithiobacillus thiooxidans TaxID=930 RepID=UPI001C070B8B|nr:pyridoxal-dependent decarboxylase [Acidithiobacillus thiooxidans]MBU2752516.1 aspartate aminotransferase family protein [Acidithiobacillus thiooxidans]